MKAYRERLKANPEKRADIKKKDKERKKISRQIELAKLEILSPRMKQNMILDKKLKAAERQRKCRQMKKNSKEQSISNTTDEDEIIVIPSKVYATKQAAGKAL